MLFIRYPYEMKTKFYNPTSLFLILVSLFLLLNTTYLSYIAFEDAHSFAPRHLSSQGDEDLFADLSKSLKIFTCTPIFNFSLARLFQQLSGLLFPILNRPSNCVLRC